MILPYNWKERLRPEPIRESINRNTAVIGVIALVVAIVALTFIVRQFFPRPTGQTPQVYFYDISNKTTTIGPKTNYPPLIGSTGQPTVVYAFYFTCSTPENKYLAYLEKYSPQTQQMLHNTVNGSAQINNQRTTSPDILVCLPSDTANWVPVNSPEGLKIIQLQPCPEGHMPQQCLP
jgi:hypothetical protein